MPALLACGWGAVVVFALRRRRGRADHVHLDAARTDPAPPWVSMGRWVQGRVPVLASLGAPTVGLLVAVAGLLVPFDPMAAVIAFGALLVVAAAVRVRRVAGRRRQLEERAPGGWELLRLACASGFTLPEAVRVVSIVAADPFGELLGQVHRRVDRGQEFGAALDAVSARGGAVVEQPLAQLAGAHRAGSSTSDALGRAADRQRSELRRRAEERARRLPVWMLLPLVCCVLPSFGLLTVVPMLAGGLDGLRLP